MAYAFDTLGYAKRIEAAGVDRDKAEAHVEAVRDFVMVELVTKSDMRDALERQALQLTVRLGGVMAGLMAAAVVVLGFIIPMH